MGVIGQKSFVNAAIRRSGRATWLAGLSALGLVAGLVPAAAQAPLQFAQNPSEWADGFDVTVPNEAPIYSSEPMLGPQSSAYLATAIQRYQTIAAAGGWPVVPGTQTLRLGMSDPAVVTLRQRLIATGDLEPVGGLSESFDSYVDAAVRRFQIRHGLTADGIVGGQTLTELNVPAEQRVAQLQANLQRVRDMGDLSAPRYVVVNIPAALIETVENGAVHSRHQAIVGKIDRQTPVLNSQIVEVNFNPFWTVPTSIIRKDLIPLMQEDPEYLTRNHIRVFNGQGAEVQPQSINWNSNEAVSYTFRQDPGADNSLGYVRINFPNPYSVYMHDTPSKNLFGDDLRFDSSGCVRVQNVREYVAWLLEDQPGWTVQNIENTFQAGQQLTVKLPRAVPLHFVYVTAWASADGVVQFRPDIYDKDGLRPATAVAAAPADGGTAYAPASAASGAYVPASTTGEAYIPGGPSHDAYVPPAGLSGGLATSAPLNLLPNGFGGQ